MADPSTTRRPWTAHLAVLLAAVVLTWIFLRRIATYWAFFHMGSAGANGFALLLVFLPVALVLATGSAWITLHLLTRRRIEVIRASLGAATVAALALILLFGIEVLRTAELRVLESAATLGDYFRAHPW